MSRMNESIACNLPRAPLRSSLCRWLLESCGLEFASRNLSTNLERTYFDQSIDE